MNYDRNKNSKMWSVGGTDAIARISDVTEIDPLWLEHIVVQGDTKVCKCFYMDNEIHGCDYWNAMDVLQMAKRDLNTAKESYDTAMAAVEQLEDSTEE
jgi:hypothetical protein